MATIVNKSETNQMKRLMIVWTVKATRKRNSRREKNAREPDFVKMAKNIQQPTYKVYVEKIYYGEEGDEAEKGKIENV